MQFKVWIYPIIPFFNLTYFFLFIDFSRIPYHFLKFACSFSLGGIYLFLYLIIINLTFNKKTLR